MIESSPFSTVIATQRSPHWPNILGARWACDFAGGAITVNSTQALHAVVMGEEISALTRHDPGVVIPLGGAPAPKPMYPVDDSA